MLATGDTRRWRDGVRLDRAGSGRASSGRSLDGACCPVCSRGLSRDPTPPELLLLGDPAPGTLLPAAPGSDDACARAALLQDQELHVQRKKRRSVNKNAVRSVAGTSLEVIAKKRAEKPEQRKASREAALREIKERAKKDKATKAAQKATGKAAGKAAPAKNVPRGAGKASAKSTGR